jgi:serine/threonine protein kinase
VYLLSLLEENHIVDGVVKWIHIKDADPMEFGTRGENHNLSDRLWEFKGQLMILSSPHIPGRHYATSVSQLLAAVERLESLHNKGYVHGDIRAYNIIFGFGTAELIDFDFGGVEDRDSTVYPEGYNQALCDGHRLGKAGKPITKRHDWRALLYILFNLHVLESPLIESALPTNDKHGQLPLSHSDDVARTRVRIETYRLHLERDRLRQSFAAVQDPSDDEVKELKDFLVMVNSWNVRLLPEFQSALSMMGFYIKSDTT